MHASLPSQVSVFKRACTSLPWRLPFARLAVHFLLGVPLATHGAPPQAADTPAALIKADYQTKAAVVVSKLNETLTKQVARAAAELLKDGDTQSAEQVTAQLTEKLGGQDVNGPHEAVKLLFNQYDAAMTRALQPLQQAALTKIEAALKSSVARDAAVVAALGRVQAEIANIPVVTAQPAPLPASADTRLQMIKTPQGSSFSRLWSYHRSADAAVMGVLTLQPDATWQLLDVMSTGETEHGTWQATPDNALELVVGSKRWKGVIATPGAETEINRSDIGKRHLKALTGPQLEELVAPFSPATRPLAGLDAGPAPGQKPPPMVWTYHMVDTPEGVAYGQMHLHPNGRLDMLDRREPLTTGTWKADAAGKLIALKIRGMEWTMTISPTGETATLDRDVGRRHMRLKNPQPAFATVPH